MNQASLLSLASLLMAAILLAVGGCGANGLGPLVQPPAKSSEAGVVAVRPNAPSATPTNGASAEKSSTNPYQNLPLEVQQEIQQKIAANAARAEQARAEMEKAKAALDALKAEQAARVDLDRPITPEESAEDRRLHPPSQIWLTLSNLKVSKGDLYDMVVTMDYRLVCGSPRKYGFYSLYVYVLEPHEKKVTEDTKRSEQSVPLADKPNGSLTLRIPGVFQELPADRIVAVLVRPSIYRESLANRQISGFLTTRASTSDPNPPPLLSALVGAEAQGKPVVLAPFQERVRKPFVSELDFDIPFQIYQVPDVSASYRISMTSADRQKVTFDIGRELSTIEPFTNGMLRLNGGPVLPSEAPVRPYRFQVERQARSGDEWEVVSNVITLQ